MKKLSSGIMLFLSLFGGLQIFGQETEEKVLKEYVSVTNVEMVLRIMKDGRTLGGFKKEDLRLLENGIEVPINGFFELKKRMKAERPQGQESQPTPGRLFLLMFWATQAETEIGAHLDQFFREVYSPGDRVILSGGTLQLEITNPSDMQQIRSDFLSGLKEQITQKQEQWNARHRELNYDIDYLIRNTKLNRDAGEVASLLDDFKKKYALFMKEIDFLNRSVDFDSMEKMCQDLSTIHVSKWAMLFFEAERIPMVDIPWLKNEIEKGLVIDDDGLLLSSWFKNMMEIEMEMAKLGRQYNLFEKLRSRFIQADTVFHFLQMASETKSKVRKADENDMLVFKPISSNWETILKEVSQSTGGRISRIDRDPSVLNPLFETEDISYLLTYVPADRTRKNSKVTILLKNETEALGNRNLIYGKRIEMAETPTIQIDHIRHSRDLLTLACSQFYPIYTPQGPRGHIHVLISGKTRHSGTRILFQGDMEYHEPVNIPLNLQEEGDWELDVEVSDYMTRQKASRPYSLRLMAAQSATESVPDADLQELAPILERCAQYSERLKKAALRFFCTEKVAEKVATGIKTSHYKKWKYDYQIVLQSGKVTEHRREGKSKKEEAALLETLYKSHYSFFLPVTFLNRDRQDDYRYSLIGREKQQKRSLVHISAVPILAGSNLPAGQLWIDEQDGSVLQITLDPKTLTGFKDRYLLAERNRKLITITDTHQYHQRYRDMQFPTSTYITEKQELKDLPASLSGMTRHAHLAHILEPTVYSVHYQYEDFRFFDIDTSEQITGWVEE